MTISTPYDVLPTASADYEAETLSIACTMYGPEEGGKNVLFVEGDDGLIDGNILSSTTSFLVTIDYIDIPSADQVVLWDLFHDAAKGNCGTRTVKWLSPMDSKTYVARILGNGRKHGMLKREYRQYGAYYTYRGVVVMLEGKYA